MKERLVDIVEWKNLTVVDGYKHEPLNADELYDWLMKYGSEIIPYICNTTEYINAAADEGKSILLEAQLGALRDIDFGIYPYTSSSNALGSYGPIGVGAPNLKIDNTIGIMKAYSSCVGEGPFVSEYFGDEAHWLREAGGEYGAATGRPRRVGSFDVVASKYGAKIQGADCIALTKLDVLSGLKRIPICTAYEIDGKITTDFLLGERLKARKAGTRVYGRFLRQHFRLQTAIRIARRRAALCGIHREGGRLPYPLWSSVGAERE